MTPDNPLASSLLRSPRHEPFCSPPIRCVARRVYDIHCQSPRSAAMKGLHHTDQLSIAVNASLHTGLTAVMLPNDNLDLFASNIDNCAASTY
jgi:hypothetical protein